VNYDVKALVPYLVKSVASSASRWYTLMI